DFTPLWHPSQVNTGGQGMILDLAFSALVRLDEDFKTFLPDLAERWEVSPDATQFTFYLRRGVKWHDGAPFTAKDVVFSLTRAIINVGFAPTRWVMRLKGAAEYKDGKADTVAGIQQLDDYTVRLTLNAPDAFMMWDLADPYANITPEHLLKDVAPNA